VTNRDPLTPDSPTSKVEKANAVLDPEAEELLFCIFKKLKPHPVVLGKLL
jgi:hypothetical protein